MGATVSNFLFIPDYPLIFPRNERDAGLGKVRLINVVIFDDKNRYSSLNEG